LKKRGANSQYLPRCVYRRARIFHAMAGSRRDFGSYRLGAVDYINFERWWLVLVVENRGIFPSIWLDGSIMLEWDLGSSRLGPVEDL
jgi:hypothetical protein